MVHNTVRNDTGFFYELTYFFQVIKINVALRFQIVGGD